MFQLFQPGSEDDPSRPKRAPEVVDATGTGRWLVCSGCGQRITTTGARIEIGGSHEHECVNPHGWRWRIGCFAFAEGVVPIGAPEAYWSWFTGYTWQIENCARCRQLIGWLYQSGDRSFHGLVIAHLREEE